MPNRCGLCANPLREEIDALLRGEHNVHQMARDYGVTRVSIMRHRANHVRAAKAGDEPYQSDPPEPPPAPKTVAQQQTAFLTAYAATCDVKAGLKASSVTRATFRKWQEHDPEFSLRFRQAEIEAIESLEYEARLRAVAGSKLVRRVYRQGLLYEEIHEWRPSDAIMTRLLQAAKPEKYGDRLTVTQTTVVKAVDAEAWAAV